MNNPLISRITNFTVWLLILAPGLLLLSSCNKDKGDSTVLKCKVDGVPIEFTTAFAHVDDPAGGVSGLLINGQKNGSTPANFLIAISTLPVTEREYTDTESNVNTLVVYGADGTTQYDAGTMVYQSALRENVTLVNHLRVRVTELSKTSVRGQFSGDFYEEGDVLGTKITITEGEFFAKVQ